MRLWAGLPAASEPDDDATSIIIGWFWVLGIVMAGITALIGVGVGLAIGVSLVVDSAFARDNGQWADTSPSICARMKATDTLIFRGHRQHAERFIECTVGHWPNVHSVFREAVR